MIIKEKTIAEILSDYRDNKNHHGYTNKTTGCVCSDEGLFENCLSDDSKEEPLIPGNCHPFIFDEELEDAEFDE